MSKVTRYGMLLGAIVGVIAGVMGVLLFYVLTSYENFLVNVGFTLLLGLVVGAALAIIVIVLLGVLIAIFGGTMPDLSSLFNSFISAVSQALFYPQFFLGLDYSSRALLYGTFFLILLIASGILIAAGFFSKYSEDRRTSYIVGGVFGLVGLSLGGVCIYLGLQPLSGYALSFFEYLLVFSANLNFGLIGIGSLLLFLGFLIFGITHLRTREESERPTLGAGIGAMEIITGIVMLGGTIGAITILAGTISVIMLTVGFALMLITFILWIPYAWAEHK